MRLRLGPETIYLVSGASNVQTLFARSRDLSTKALTLLSLGTAFAMPAADIKIYEDDDSGILVKPLPGSNVAPEKRLLHKTHHLFGHELNGIGLAELSRQFVKHFATQIAKRSEEIGDDFTEIPDLYRLSGTRRSLLRQLRCVVITSSASPFHSAKISGHLIPGYRRS